MVISYRHYYSKQRVCVCEHTIDLSENHYICLSPPIEAFVSLATNDSYATGALTLGRSIRDSGTCRKLALMITNGVSEDMRYL